MPCRSDHMEPNLVEAESKRVCNLLCYILPKIGRTVPEHVNQGDKGTYGSPQTIHEDTAILCEVCKNLTEDQLNKFVYDGRNADARRLADWWDKHQEADRQREEEEEARSAEKRREIVDKQMNMLLYKYPKETLNWMQGRSTESSSESE